MDYYSPTRKDGRLSLPGWLTHSRHYPRSGSHIDHKWIRANHKVGVSEWVEFNAPPDTIQVISEAEHKVGVEWWLLSCTVLQQVCKCLPRSPCIRAENFTELPGSPEFDVFFFLPAAIRSPFRDIPLRVLRRRRDPAGTRSRSTSRTRACTSGCRTGSEWCRSDKNWKRSTAGSTALFRRCTAPPLLRDAPPVECRHCTAPDTQSPIKGEFKAKKLWLQLNIYV